MEEKDKPEEAGKLFLQAWNEATTDFEKYIAAHFVARHQKNVSGKLKWLETTLQFAIVGEVSDWVRQTPEDIQKWREKLANVKGEIIN